jgi:hypothetical protein
VGIDGVATEGCVLLPRVVFKAGVGGGAGVGVRKAYGERYVCVCCSGAGDLFSKVLGELKFLLICDAKPEPTPIVFLEFELAS